MTPTFSGSQLARDYNMLSRSKHPYTFILLLNNVCVDIFLLSMDNKKILVANEGRRL